MGLSTDFEEDNLSPADYNMLMKQGGEAFKSGSPLDQNPHIDDESRAAWAEGWQWEAYRTQEEAKH